jgi:hypothetical protein
VILQFVVVDGLPRNIQITRSLGLGLDNKAIVGVKNGASSPLEKTGKPWPCAQPRAHGHRPNEQCMRRLHPLGRDYRHRDLVRLLPSNLS